MNQIQIRRVFFALAVFSLCLAAILSGSISQSSATSSEPQNMLGRWDGFLAKMGDPSQPVRTEITSQTNRRFVGLVTPPDPVLPVSIEGTVSASGKVNFQGQSVDGAHTVGKTDLLDFGGGAAILNGSLTRFSNDGTFIVPCILVMRPFDVEPGCPCARPGSYAGSLTGTEVQGQINMVLSTPPEPVRPTSFGGTVEIVIDGQTHQFQLLGTSNSAGRFIAIAHATSGHMILDAVFQNPPDPVQAATLNGSFTLEFADGSGQEGTFQTQLVGSISPIDR